MRSRILKPAGSIIDLHVLPLLAHARAKQAESKRIFEAAKAEYDADTAQLSKLLEATAVLRDAANGAKSAGKSRTALATNEGGGDHTQSHQISSTQVGVAGRVAPDGKRTPTARYVKEIIFSRTAPFTAPDIGQALQKEYPEVHADLPTGYISAIIWKAQKAGKLLATGKKTDSGLLLYANLKK